VPNNATITVGNSYSRIIGLKEEALADLRKELSYLPGGESAVVFSRFPPKRQSLIDKKGNVPTGLLTYVHEFLQKNQITFGTNDTRKVPQKTARLFHMAPTLTPYPAQMEAVRRASLAKQCGLVMPTGSGKSFVIAMLANVLQVRTLVVVPSLEIKHQLQAAMRTYFLNDSHITICNIDSKKLQNAKDYDCLIIDECHHAAAKTYQKLNKSVWNGIYYRFFLSATFFRNQTNEHLLFEAICGQPAYELSYHDAVKAKYVVPVEAYYLKMPKIVTGATTWAEVYRALVTQNMHRNERIALLMLRLQAQERSTLTLVKEISHGNTLSTMTGIPFANGQDDDSRTLIKAFAKGQISALIGTTGIIGEGVDTKPCEYVIIAGLGKAKSAFMQQVGRAVRTYPGKESAKVVLIRDPSHKFTVRHYNAQKKVLLEVYGTTPLELEL
jgi:superfamily II DNA or RNA helicase